MSKRNWFVEIWDEAYTLRKDGQDDPRLDILNELLEEFGFTFEVSETPNVLRLLPGDREFDDYEMLDKLISTAEVRKTFGTAKNYEPVDCLSGDFNGRTALEIWNANTPDDTKTVTAAQIQGAKYECWMNGVELPERSFCRTVNVLIKQMKELDALAEANKPGPKLQ